MFSSAVANKPDFILPKMYFEFPHKATGYFWTSIKWKRKKKKRKIVKEIK